MTDAERLAEIAAIIEAVDNRCAAADGPVTPTLREMTQKELTRIYKLASRATPPDGPCVWIARFGLTGGYAAYSTRLYLTEPEKMDVHGEVCWPSGGVQLPTDMAGTLGLAPGACQRFRLVPEGETP